MTINTNIENNLSADEKEVFSVIRTVIAKYSPSTNAYAVGGWTRDKLMGVPSDDIDIMIDNMSGENFAKFVTKHLNIEDANVIRENPEASKHITTAKAFIPLSSGKIQEIDFAQARSEVYRGDSRIPEIQVATPQEDAHRRDLTINSIFYDINKHQIVDFTGKGLKDLITKTFRTPEDPLKTFSDDPLRIFRVIRFTAKYNGKIDPQTYAAMTNPSLRAEINQKISKERIGIEIGKMFKNPNPEYALKLLKDTGLMEDILTEALRGTKYEGKMAPLDMNQKNAHHKLTIWEHTMEALKNVLEKYQEAEPEKRIVMILATLMHDLGKLYYDIQGQSTSHPGSISYHGHEKESREIAEHILKYIKMEPYIQQVAGLAHYHMRPHLFTRDKSGANAMRKFIRQMGEQSLNWLDIFNLAMADALAKDVTIDPTIAQEYQTLENELEAALLSLKPTQEETIKPVLNGTEVMQILGVKQGRWMGEIMEFVKELRDENPDITKEEAAQKLIEKYKNSDIITAQTPGVKEKENPDSVCPMHLLKTCMSQIKDLYKEKRYYEILTILKEFKNEYGNDERVVRMIALNALKLLILDGKLRDNDLLQHIFNKAEDSFFDTVLCSSSIGILLIINSGTEDNVIKEMAMRIAKMAPGTLQSVLDILPSDMPKHELKNQIRDMIKCK